MSTSLDQIIRGAIASTEKDGKALARPWPQVSLLPGEIRGVARGRRVRGLLVAGVLATTLVVAGGVGLASQSATEADANAAAATGRLAAAGAQLAKFKDVQTLQTRIATGTAAVRVGSSTAIDWQRYVGLLKTDMPLGFTVSTVQVDGATPFADYPQGTTPLDNPRAATMVLTADTADITELPVWLRKLKSMPAFADETFTVGSGQTGYTVTVTVHLTSAAYLAPLKGGAK